MRRAEREALALGLLHGPAELVPVSSSGHVAALPWLLRWEIAGWQGARRKELEVAVHSGSAVALLLVARPERLRPALLGAAFLPPAVVGLALERRIEERLGTPATLAAGLLAGGAALLLADRVPASRAAADARVADGLALGLAQAAALIPGVSRNGATLAAARARGFGRADASRLSWEVALPVLLGATALKGVRVAQAARAADMAAGTAGAATAERPKEPPTATPGAATAERPKEPPTAAAGAATAERPKEPPTATPGAATAERVRPLALGAAAAFASTLATARAIGIERRAPLWPWAVWRAGLAGAILAVRHNRAR